MHRTTAFCGVLTLIVTALGVGCSHVNHLREAQDSFNQAASADNLDRYGGLKEEDLIDASPASASVSASAGYAATVSTIDSLKNDNQARQRMQNDGLYGYALALQSLAYWRLEKWGEAVSTSRDALDTGDLGPRDLALMTALPGLIKNNQAFDRLEGEGAALTCNEAGEPTLPPEKWELSLDGNRSLTLACSEGVIEIRDQLGSALCDIEAARTEAPLGHPVRRYLALSQLATIANMRDMCDAVSFDEAPATLASACVDATFRVEGCVVTHYGDERNKLEAAIVKDACAGRTFDPKDLTGALVQKSGIARDQIAEACPTR